MTRLPFEPRDRWWLFSRLFFLGFLLLIHPLPFDLRRWYIVIPAHSAEIAYVVFECLQSAIFAAAVFFGDMLPGMRFVTAYWGRLILEIRGDSLKNKLAKRMPFILGSGLFVWFVLTPVDAIVHAVPSGTPRFLAATAYFMIERLVVILVFVIQINSNDDDDEPGARRRSIARSVSALFRRNRVRAVARAPAAS